MEFPGLCAPAHTLTHASAHATTHTHSRSSRWAESEPPEVARNPAAGEALRGLRDRLAREALTRKRGRGGAGTLRGELGDLTAPSSLAARPLADSRGLVSRARARVGGRKKVGGRGRGGPGRRSRMVGAGPGGGSRKPGRGGRGGAGGGARRRLEELWLASRTRAAGGAMSLGGGGAGQRGLSRPEAPGEWRVFRRKWWRPDSALGAGPRLQGETSGLEASGPGSDIRRENVTFLASQFLQL